MGGTEGRLGRKGGMAREREEEDEGGEGAEMRGARQGPRGERGVRVAGWVGAGQPARSSGLLRSCWSGTTPVHGFLPPRWAQGWLSAGM